MIVSDCHIRESPTQVPMKLGRDFQDAAACWRGGDGDGRPAGVEFKFSQQQSKLQFWQ